MLRLGIAAILALAMAATAHAQVDCKGMITAGVDATPPTDTLHPSFTAGEREVNRLMTAVEGLKNRTDLNPFSTHLELFDSMVEEHLAYAEAGLKKQTSSADLPQRLLIFEDFRKEAFGRRRDQQVTYRWWILFNMRLSILLTPEAHRSTIRGNVENGFVTTLYRTGAWLRHEEVEALLQNPGNDPLSPAGDLHRNLQRFPEHIFIPTTIGDIGIIPLNRSFASGVHLIGLITEPLTADGKLMYPDAFFGHDLVHISNDVISSWAPDRAAVRALRSRMETICATLTAAERERVEYIYFLASREVPGYGVIITRDPGYVVRRLTGPDSGSPMEKQILALSMDRTWFAPLLAHRVDVGSDTAVRRYLIESGELFTRVVREAQALATPPPTR